MEGEGWVRGGGGKRYENWRVGGMVGESVQGGCRSRWWGLPVAPLSLPAAGRRCPDKRARAPAQTRAHAHGQSPPSQTYMHKTLRFTLVLEWYALAGTCVHVLVHVG